MHFKMLTKNIFNDKIICVYIFWANSCMKKDILCTSYAQYSEGILSAKTKKRCLYFINS